jgi:hypothetical protein
LDNELTFDPATPYGGNECAESKIRQFAENNDTKRLVAPTNFVPAVAVKRRGQVLLIVIGRKGCVDGFFNLHEKPWHNRGKLASDCKTRVNEGKVEFFG